MMKTKRAQLLIGWTSIGLGNTRILTNPRIMNWFTWNFYMFTVNNFTLKKSFKSKV